MGFMDAVAVRVEDAVGKFVSVGVVVEAVFGDEVIVGVGAYPPCRQIFIATSADNGAFRSILREPFSASTVCER
jgi:hypothetical protein